MPTSNFEVTQVWADHKDGPAVVNLQNQSVHVLRYATRAAVPTELLDGMALSSNLASNTHPITIGAGEKLYLRSEASDTHKVAFIDGQ